MHSCTLPALSQSAANEGGWQDLLTEEKEQLLQQLRDTKQERAEKKVAKVTQAHVGNDIETTLVRLNAEVSPVPIPNRICNC